MRNSNIKIKKQRGTEIIEFTLTLPFMLMLFAAFLEFGVGFADKAVIVDASRAAAREAIRGKTESDCWIAANKVLNSLISWGAEDKYECPSCVGENCLCKISPSDLTTANPGDQITVSIDFPFKFQILDAFMPTGLKENFSLSGSTIMYVTHH